MLAGVKSEPQRRLVTDGFYSSRHPNSMTLPPPTQRRAASSVLLSPLLIRMQPNVRRKLEMWRELDCEPGEGQAHRAPGRSAHAPNPNSAMFSHLSGFGQQDVAPASSASAFQSKLTP